MKKVAILCTLMFASFSFANESVSTKNSFYTTVTSNNSSQYEVKLKNGDIIRVTVTAEFTSRGRWRVEFVNACGDFINVGFSSDYADGTPEFINDLANVVNANYEC
ncbi:hypothetical protein [Chryseobacterium sp. GP-SGM7]|uniref:hypothetical protein n=1 Tax=Chryseobacterium sp. GP-SGM7 TaxID=3411323 RepID=UPI003B93E44A